MFKVRMIDGTEFGPADLDTIEQWCRQGRIPRDAMLHPAGGGEPKSVLAEPRLAAVIKAPPTTPAIEPPQKDDSIATIIPYKNPPALIGYYLGLFSCLPVLGLIMGPIAIWLGVKGLRRLKLDPQCKGTAHAWIAIISGIIGTLIGILFGFVIYYGVTSP